MKHSWTPALFVCAALWGAESDARRLQEKIQATHTPFGGILDPIFEGPDSDRIANYTRCGDSAIWTGHYLAAQSFRYGATRSPEALAEANRALRHLETLGSITGTGLLARCAFPANWEHAGRVADEEKRNGLAGGSVDGEQWLWVGNTSRDQYSGVFFGLTAAWNLIPEPEMQARVARLTTSLLDFLLDHGWFVVMPDGSVSTTFLHRADQQLSLLKLGRRVNPARFENRYKSLANSAAWTVSVPLATESSDPHGAYFKFNLNYINFWNLLTSGDNSFVRNGYKNAYDIMRRATAGHGNAHFNLIDRAINGPNAARDEETRRLLDEWLERPLRDFVVDLRGEVAQCGDRACTPIPVTRRVATDFLWQRSPFQLTGGGNGYIESSGLDYLLPYWMARYYGIISS